MNKRQRKKKEDAALRKQGIFVLKNLQSGRYRVYVAKKHWNKGSREKGCIEYVPTGDALTIEYAEEQGFKNVGYAQDCGDVHIEILPSWNNKTHIVRIGDLEEDSFYTGQIIS